MVTLSKLALASRSEVAVVESGLSYGQSTAFSVSVKEPGRVTLTGVVENEKGRIRAEGVVQGVKGVEPVDNQIRVRPGDQHA
jgi:osmotically-inducible protein OsmY